jgi:hypothetical protein
MNEILSGLQGSDTKNKLNAVESLLTLLKSNSRNIYQASYK